MLPQSLRLRKTKDIESLFKRGRSAYSNSLGAKIYPNQLGKLRFTILVNKKVSKKAVERNRLKRCLREMLKQKLQLSSGIDLIIICQPSSIKLDSVSLITELNLILQRLKLS